MTFTHLPQLARFIRRTHSTFAGSNVENALSVLGDMNLSMKLFPAMVGATFEARTNSDHGDLATLVEINRMPQGGWHYTERIAV